MASLVEQFDNLDEYNDGPIAEAFEQYCLDNGLDYDDWELDYPDEFKVKYMQELIKLMS